MTRLPPLVLLCALGVCAAAVAPSCAAEPIDHAAPCSRALLPDRDPLRVLFIGNSYFYFNNLPALFSAIAERCRNSRVETDMVVQGGATLRDLWMAGRAPGLIVNAKWDYVVLQEHSTLGRSAIGAAEPGSALNDPADFLSYACRFAALIRRSGARAVLLGTWPRQNYPQVLAELRRVYATAAEQCDVRIAPAGEAWQLAQVDLPQLALYQADRSHPTPAGSYLAAGVLYAAIFHSSPEGAASRISGIPIDIDGVPLHATAGESPAIQSSPPLVALVDLNPAVAVTLQRIAARAAAVR